MEIRSVGVFDPHTELPIIKTASLSFRLAEPTLGKEAVTAANFAVRNVEMTPAMLERLETVATQAWEVADREADPAVLMSLWGWDGADFSVTPTSDAPIFVKSPSEVAEDVAEIRHRQARELGAALMLIRTARTLVGKTSTADLTHGAS